MDQGSTMKRSAVHNFAPTVTKFCVMWEGQALPHDTKFGNSRCEIVGRRVIFIWSLIHGLRWSGLIKAEPDKRIYNNEFMLGMDQAINIISYLLYKWLQTEYRDQNICCITKWVLWSTLECVAGHFEVRCLVCDKTLVQFHLKFDYLTWFLRASSAAPVIS